MLSAISLVLLSLATLLVASVCFVKLRNKTREKGRPPVVKGSSLIFGSAHEFGTKLLVKCQKEYGDVYTVRLFTSYMTVLMDARNIEGYFSEKNIDFTDLENTVNRQVFEFDPKDQTLVVSKLKTLMRKKPLETYMHSFQANLEETFQQLVQKEDSLTGGPSTWTTDDLMDFAAKTYFTANFHALFGHCKEPNKFDAKVVCQNMPAFQDCVPLYASGMPKIVLPHGWRAFNKMLNQSTIDEYLKRDDLSDYIRNYALIAKAEGPNRDRNFWSHNIILANVFHHTMVLVFWMMYYLMKDGKAMDALVKEIQEAIEERLDTSDNTASFTISDVEGFKVLDSVLRETSRMTNGFFILRTALKDLQFKTHDGKSFLIKKDERMVMLPEIAHGDPEIFEDPKTFKFDRFIDATFFKGKQEVLRPQLGYGPTCLGRRVAPLQQKWFMINLLSRADIQLVSTDEPQHDHSTLGREVHPPDRPVHMRYKLRKEYPRLHLTAGGEVGE